jgi:uncharacterized protein YabE (DUF348 family)
MRKRIRRFKRKYTVAQRKHVRRVRKIVRHPLFTVPSMTFLALLAATAALLFVLNGGSAKIGTSSNDIVIINHDGGQQIVPTHEPTVGALLAKLNIKLGQGDVVEPALTTEISQDDFRINIYRAVPVEVVDGSSSTFTFSAATTPRAIAVQAGAQLYPEDDVSQEPTNNFLADDAIGERIVINRATPVNVNLYGTPTVLRTHTTTVGALLADEHITLGKDDSVDPAPATPISPNLQIFLIHKGTQIQSVTQTIAMPVQTIEDNTLAYGTSAIRQAGSAGQQVLTYQVNLQNGKPVGQTLIQTVVTQQPVTQIVAQGTNLSGIKGDMALAGIAPSDYSSADYIISNESGWCTTKWQGDYGACPAYHGTPSSSYIGYGLCQATPGYKMSSFGSDWALNPVTQLEWCNNYAVTRYGGWKAAAAHWAANRNW